MAIIGSVNFKYQTLTVKKIKRKVSTFIDRRKDDIVIGELPPLHYHQSVSDVWGRNVIVHICGDETRRCQRFS